MTDLQDALNNVSVELTESGWEVKLGIITPHNMDRTAADMAQIVKAARKVANPDLTVLDGYPDLYELAPKQLAALKELGVSFRKVPGEYIVGNVLRGIGEDTNAD